MKSSKANIKNSRELYTCRDCGYDNCAFYMLKNTIWKRVWEKRIPRLDNHHRQILCWQCAQERNGHWFYSHDLDETCNCNEIILQLLRTIEMSDPRE